MLRIGIGALAIALIAVTAVPAVVHAGHGADQDCEVCEQTNESLADLSDELQVRPTDIPQALLTSPGVVLVLPYPGAQAPARAPPLSVFPLL